MEEKNEQLQERARLKRKIIRALRKQGLTVQRGRIVPPDGQDKERIRELHEAALQHKIARSRGGLEGHENELLCRIATGADVVPARIRPRLVEVQSGSRDELLFRYATLHWSIPVSSGYGRRLRFLVLDEFNGKLIGVIGLGDPVFSLHDRDVWVGWSLAERKQRLRYVMDAFVLGAVPPYSSLLCGKLVALLTSSVEVRKAFRKKYRGSESRIAHSSHDGRLAMITTTSALGRSSIYNRLKYRERHVFYGVGFTGGYGEFQFCNGVYDTISAYAQEHCERTAKHDDWGTGFRNRREVVRKCLVALGLSMDLMNHGIRRELFAVPLAKNAKQFLCGQHSRLQSHRESVDDLAGFFQERWLLRRANWDESYKEFNRDDFRLW